jgi:DNA-binding response OmpR family regulator
MAKTILVVDTDRRLLSVIESYLGLDGYRVLTACSAHEALYWARGAAPDVMIVALRLPDEKGCREFLAAYQQERPLPIILLLVPATDADRLAALDLDANDYLTEPFPPRALSVRIHKAILRLGQADLPPRVLEVSGIVLDKGSRLVKVGALYVDLTPSEFDVLAMLMSSPGRVVSRSDLLDVVQGIGSDGNARLIDIHIKNLRAKIERKPHSPRYIETVYGFGYRFSRSLPESAALQKEAQLV